MHDTLHALRYYVFIVLMQIINKLRECAVVFGRSDTFSVDAISVALPAVSRLMPGKAVQPISPKQARRRNTTPPFFMRKATSNHK